MDNIQKIEEKMDELDKLHELEQAINSNVIEFDYEDEVYRVRKPTLRETEHLNYARMKKYNEMVSDEEYKFEDQLKENYKKKDIDLDKIQTKLIEYQKKEEDLLRKLHKQKIKSEIDKFKESIISIRQKKYDLLNKKNNLLKFSIESQLTNYMNSYLLSMILEKKVENEWQKVFKNYEEYIDCNKEELILLSTYHLSRLVFRNAV